MKFHRALSDEELRRDFFVGFSRSHKVKDLLLALRKRLPRPGVAELKFDRDRADQVALAINDNRDFDGESHHVVSAVRKLLRARYRNGRKHFWRIAKS